MDFGIHEALFWFFNKFLTKNVCNNKNGFGLIHMVIFTFDQP